MQIVCANCGRVSEDVNYRCNCKKKQDTSSNDRFIYPYSHKILPIKPITTEAMGMEQITLNGETTNKPEPVEKEKMDNEEKATLISYLYKSCRIGDSEKALEIAERFKRAGMEYYIANTLIQLLGEDCSPDEWQRLYPTITAYRNNVASKTTRGHCMWHVVYAVAKARKWYQTADGEELEHLRQKVKDKNLPPLKIPSWVYDYHTRAGRKQGSSADSRLDGRWGFRFSIRDRWLGVTGGIPEYGEKVKAWIKSHY